MDSEKSNILTLKEEIKVMKLKNLSEIEKFKHLFNIGLELAIPESLMKKRKPYFIGCIASDIEGKTICILESSKGDLDYFLKQNIEEKEKKALFDLELIPMFISAIEKFSQELNIQELAGLNLKGLNINIKIFNINNFIFILFLHPNTNFEFVQEKVNDFLTNLLRDNKQKFEIFSKEGLLPSNISEIIETGQEWLKELNDYYIHQILNLEIFDFESVNTIFYRFESIYDKINLNFFTTLNKLKQMKKELTLSINQDDYEKIKNIAIKIEEINMIINST